MGRLVAEAVAGDVELRLGACYDPGVASGEAGGLAISGDPHVVAGSDVVVEFTTPEVVLGNLRRWHDFGVHAVVGTSGFDADRIDALGAFWGPGDARCLVVPNFSIGAVLMMRFAEEAAAHFRAAEIIELHHDGKADAPSGTALATARRVGAVAPDQRRAVEGEEAAAGARGALVDGVRVHAVRLPGLLAHQEVLFGGSGETLSIRHDTTDRSAFVPGVLLAIRAVGGLSEPLTVGLEQVLGT